MEGDGNAAGFLADEDGHGVAILADPEGRLVAGTEFPGQGTGRGSEENASPGNLVIFDDHRSIMELGSRIENSLQEFFGDRGVDIGPPLLDDAAELAVAQKVVFLHDGDESAHLELAHPNDRRFDLVIDGFAIEEGFVRDFPLLEKMDLLALEKAIRDKIAVFRHVCEKEDEGNDGQKGEADLEHVRDRGRHGDDDQNIEKANDEPGHLPLDDQNQRRRESGEKDDADDKAGNEIRIVPVRGRNSFEKEVTFHHRPPRRGSSDGRSGWQHRPRWPRRCRQ